MEKKRNQQEWKLGKQEICKKHDYVIGCEAFMEVKIGQDRLRQVKIGKDR